MNEKITSEIYTLYRTEMLKNLIIIGRGAQVGRWREDTYEGTMLRYGENTNSEVFEIIRDAIEKGEDVFEVVSSPYEHPTFEILRVCELELTSGLATIRSHKMHEDDEVDAMRYYILPAAKRAGVPLVLSADLDAPSETETETEMKGDER